MELEREYHATAVARVTYAGKTTYSRNVEFLEERKRQLKPNIEVEKRKLEMNEDSD